MKWQKLYEEDIAEEEKDRILSSLNRAIREAAYNIPRVWGAAIEDRGSQITFAALDQHAPWKIKISGILIMPNGPR